MGADGRSSGRRSVASPRSSAFYAQATEVIKLVHALVTNMQPFTAQQLPDAAVLNKGKRSHGIHKPDFALACQLALVTGSGLLVLYGGKRSGKMILGYYE